MIMEEWSGVIGFVVALIFSILVCRIILRSEPQSRNSNDLRYQEHVIHAIRPTGGDVSIDQVVEVLRKEDLSVFSLLEYRDRSFDENN